MTILRGHIGDPSNIEKSGKQINQKIWLLSVDQWNEASGFPTRNSDREVANIPLLADEFWHYIQSVLDSPESKWTGETGDVAATLKDEVKFIVGGMDKTLMTFLEEGIGKGFFVVWQKCAGSKKYIAGTPCKPMRFMSFDGGSTKDNTSTTLTFISEGPVIVSEYVGSMPTESAELVAANATSIAMTDKSTYQTTSGTAAQATMTGYTSVTDEDINRVVTVLGSGGTYPPKITSANNFVLNGGAEWVANAGSEISFKVFKDGASTYKFIEVIGSRL